MIITIISLYILFVICPYNVRAAASTHAHMTHFDYTDQISWAKTFPDCGQKWQSPIVIAASRSVTLALPALEMIGYHELLEPPLKFKNNGHTVSLVLKSSSPKQTPYIFGAVFKPNDKYELESFHFHWGLRNNRGSEHVLHGTRYPMEMHLVHRNTKYRTIEAAMEHTDGLVVLAFFFQLEEEDNEQLKPLISHLPEIKFTNSETYLNSTMTLASFLPENLQTYYTYRGSLTTPPCKEAVTWIVFANAIPISFKQMSKFRVLSNGKSILGDNFRSLQDLNLRKVYVRRMQTSQNVKDYVVVDVENLQWK